MASYVTGMRYTYTVGVLVLLNASQVTFEGHRSVRDWLEGVAVMLRDPVNGTDFLKDLNRKL